MKNIKILIPAFIILASAQLYVPAKMILDQEDIIKSGAEYKFKTAPIDPNDPFRGKYIRLDFNDALTQVDTDLDWTYNEEIFVLLARDDNGFAYAQSVQKEAPTDHHDYLVGEVRYEVDAGSHVTIDYPFDIFFMDEFKAYEAELAYRDSQIDSTQTTWALVSVKEGNTVLKDVLIDGVPIKEVAEKRLEEEMP